MSKPREYPYEPLKRKVPFWLFMAFLAPIGFLWWLTDRTDDFSVMTRVLCVFGLLHISKGIARTINEERAVRDDLRAMKKIK